MVEVVVMVVFTTFLVLYTLRRLTCNHIQRMYTVASRVSVRHMMHNHLSIPDLIPSPELRCSWKVKLSVIHF